MVAVTGLFRHLLSAWKISRLVVYSSMTCTVKVGSMTGLVPTINSHFGALPELDGCILEHTSLFSSMKLAFQSAFELLKVKLQHCISNRVDDCAVVHRPNPVLEVSRVIITTESR